jgi:hypothetical protein
MYNNCIWVNESVWLCTLVVLDTHLCSFACIQCSKCVLSTCLYLCFCVYSCQKVKHAFTISQSIDVCMCCVIYIHIHICIRTHIYIHILCSWQWREFAQVVFLVILFLWLGFSLIFRQAHSSSLLKCKYVCNIDYDCDCDCDCDYGRVQAIIAWT